MKVLVTGATGFVGSRIVRHRPVLRYEGLKALASIACEEGRIMEKLGIDLLTNNQ